MSGRSDPKISKRSVETLTVKGKDAVFWDGEMPEFGVRLNRTGRNIYVVQTRGPNGLKRVTLGRYGEISTKQSRKEAAAVIDRIKRGMDPVPAPPKDNSRLQPPADKLGDAPTQPHLLHRSQMRRAFLLISPIQR